MESLISTRASARVRGERLTTTRKERGRNATCGRNTACDDTVTARPSLIDPWARMGWPGRKRNKLAETDYPAEVRTVKHVLPPRASLPRGPPDLWRGPGWLEASRLLLLQGQPPRRAPQGSTPARSVADLHEPPPARRSARVDAPAQERGRRPRARTLTEKPCSIVYRNCYKNSHFHPVLLRWEGTLPGISTGGPEQARAMHAGPGERQGGISERRERTSASLGPNLRCPCPLL